VRKVKKKLLRIVAILASVIVLAVSSVMPVMAATTQDVTITATPTYIALTNSEATWAVGVVTASTAYWWTADDNAPDPEPFEAADMKSTITNTGSVAEDIDIKVAAFTGGDGWAISTDDSPAEGEISIRAGVTGTTNEAGMVQVITTDNELTGSLAAAGTIKWCMEMETPASFTDGAEKTGVVTLTATQDA